MLYRRRDPLGKMPESKSARWGKLRLLGLFFLFDALLIIAVLLSFQGTELIQEEVTRIQTREVFETRIHELVITDTTVITQVMPNGWAP
jgi:hypothetical protein